MRSRWLCHWGASPSPSAAASAARTARGLVAQLVERPGRAAELHDEELGHRAASSRARWRSSGAAPARDAVAGGDRDRRLHAGAAHQAAGAEALGESVEGGDHCPSRAARTGSAAFSRSTSAVSMTSWLVAPKCRRAACGSPTAARSWRTSSGTTTPSRAVAAREGADVGLEPGERLCDRLGGAGRDEAGAGLGRGERGLEGEHGGELGLGAGEGVDLGVAEEAGEPGMVGGGGHQMSRNTVSPSPCRRMSKR